jgi:hypothetical protein
MPTIPIIIGVFAITALAACTSVATTSAICGAALVVLAMVKRHAPPL